MFSEIAFVFCALLAIQASLGFALPAGKKTIPELESIDEPNEPEIQEIDEEEEESYQIVLKSPKQSMKVRLVKDNKRRHGEDHKVHSADNNNKSLEQATEKYEGNTLKKAEEVSDGVEIQTEDFSENSGKKRQKAMSEEEIEFQQDGDILTTSYKCNWMHLYSLYMKKKQTLLGDKFFYPKERRKQFQKSFKIICDNPEETIAELLDLGE